MPDCASPSTSRKFTTCILSAYSKITRSGAARPWIRVTDRQAGPHYKCPGRQHRALISPTHTSTGASRPSAAAKLLRMAVARPLTCPMTPSAPAAPDSLISTTCWGGRGGRAWHTKTSHQSVTLLGLPAIGTPSSSRFNPHLSRPSRHKADTTGSVLTLPLATITLITPAAYE